MDPSLVGENTGKSGGCYKVILDKNLAVIKQEEISKEEFDLLAGDLMEKKYERELNEVIKN